MVELTMLNVSPVGYSVLFFFWFCVVVEQIRNRDGKVDDNEEEEEEGEEEEGVEESFRMGNHQ